MRWGGGATAAPRHEYRPAPVALVGWIYPQVERAARHRTARKRRPARVRLSGRHAVDGVEDDDLRGGVVVFALRLV